MVVGFGNREIIAFVEDADEDAAWVAEKTAWFNKEAVGMSPKELEEHWITHYGTETAKKILRRTRRAAEKAARMAREDAAKVVDAAVDGGEDAAIDAGAEAVVAVPEVVAEGVLVAGGDVAAGAAVGVFGGVVLVAGGFIAVGAICVGIYKALWDTGGFEWPVDWTAWENEQTIDLTDGVGKKPWLMWYEEGTGRIMVHAYATQEDSHTDTVSWHVDRVLMKWDVTTAQPKEIGRWGPGFAKRTIYCTATSAMHKQYQKITTTGIAKRGLAGTSQSVDHLTDFCRSFKAWKAKLREKAESADHAAAVAHLAANLALLASERAANVARAEGNIASAEAAKKAKEALDAANVALTEANIASAEANKKAFL